MDTLEAETRTGVLDLEGPSLPSVGMEPLEDAIMGREVERENQRVSAVRFSHSVSSGPCLTVPLGRGWVSVGSGVGIGRAHV